jgi:hypothetical protein
MKLMMLSLAGVVAASALTAVPADAQRWRDGRGWHNGPRYWHGGRHYYAPRGYYRGRYWNGRRWGRPGGRTVCRYGRYGQVRRCYRVRY